MSKLHSKSIYWFLYDLAFNELNDCDSEDTNADLKISLYFCVHIKTVPWKFLILDPKNARVACPWSL